MRLSGFWIPQARQAVKRVLSLCTMCQKFNSLSFKYPKVTNLPKHRVNLIKPFQHTGVDYTGHVWVKTEQGSSKMYMLIFTCLSIRAVHIELVQDMSTHSFILALLRFTNIYGIPSHIYSDNAKSFIAGCNLIEEVFASNEFKEQFEVYHIKHIKIPLYAPWVGSTWERMIRVIKSCLFKVIGRSRIQYFDLLTILSDIQNAINSRPLTYRCSSDCGLDIITPNSFLRPNANAGLMIKLDDQDIWDTEPPSQSDVLKSIQTRDDMVIHFRELWYESYLLSLREQCQDLHEVNFINHIKVDDVVLVKNPTKPRPYWMLGRVVELIYGDDNKARSARVRKGDGSSLVYPISHLYPLELPLTHCHQPTQVTTDSSDAENASVSNSQVSDSNDDQMPGSNDLPSQVDDHDFNDFSNSGHASSVSKRPRRQAALRSRQQSPDSPYIYY